MSNFRLNQVRKFLARILLTIITVGYISGCADGYHAKNKSVIELEISLKSVDGIPLTHYPFRVDTAPYRDDFTTTTTTDENGIYKTELSFNRGTTWLWEGMLPPDKLVSKTTLDFYLPEVNQYGEYNSFIVLDDIDEENLSTAESEYPQLVPAKIKVNKQASSDKTSQFIHGAFYYGATGTLIMARVIANGTDTRLIPMIPRGSTAFMNNVDVPIEPYLKITANKSILKDKRGWLLKLDLVVMSE